MKSRLALLAVPFLALACSDAEQPEALTNPPAPLFQIALGNGCFDVLETGVTTRRGGREVIGTDGNDEIDCNLYDLPGSKGVIVKAGDGSDLIIGSIFDDQLFGGKGCDRVEGNLGNDVVDAGPDNDNGDCTFDAGATIGGAYGQEGDDLVKGGKGDDFLDGSGGTNVCEGGKGDDEIVLANCAVCSDPDSDCTP